MERPYKAYDAKGKEYGYVTMLDARQACDIAGYTLNPPGTKAAEATVTRLDYKNMSTEAIRQMCVQRQIKGYMVLNRDQQVTALIERDAQDAAALTRNKHAESVGA